ncbi:MAG TPA: hypothetical protein VG893_03510 [Terracidiphilus sp.]|nr:hypothetical protein [Terracidiphilus sp.]
MGTTSGRVLAQLIALIEPLTRFDRSAVTVRDEATESIRCSGIWTAAIGFSSQVTEGKGKLPSGVRDAGSQSAMQEAMAQVLNTERASALDRLRKFCSAQAGLPAAAHKPLSASDCFSGPARIGHSWNCSTCSGKGDVTCIHCHGRREVKCDACENGYARCTSCSGSGQVNCNRCGGQRGWYKQVEHTVFNTAANEYTKRYENVWEHCHSCNSGKVSCSICIGKGRVNCFRCYTRGYVSCTRCQATGREKCTVCGGHGAHHRIAESSCSIRNTFAARAEDADPEVRQTVAGWSFSDYAALGHATAEAPSATASELTRPYTASLAVTRTRIHCASQDFLLLGYGDTAHVFDFKGIVSHLLAQDLEQLKTSLASGGTAALHGALATMLQSEINQQLCDSAQREALVSKGTVTAEHAESTAAMLRKAMGRLYRSSAAIAAAGLTLLSFIVLYLLYGGLYMIPGRRGKAALIYLAVMAIAAVAADFFARHRALQGFASAGSGVSAAATRLFKAAGTARFWRIGTAVAVLLSIYIFFHVVAHHPLPVYRQPPGMIVLPMRSATRPAAESTGPPQALSVPV